MNFLEDIMIFTLSILSYLAVIIIGGLFRGFIMYVVLNILNIQELFGYNLDFKNLFYLGILLTIIKSVF